MEGEIRKTARGGVRMEEFERRLASDVEARVLKDARKETAPTTTNDITNTRNEPGTSSTDRPEPPQHDQPQSIAPSNAHGQNIGVDVSRNGGNPSLIANGPTSIANSSVMPNVSTHGVATNAKRKAEDEGTDQAHKCRHEATTDSKGVKRPMDDENLMEWLNELSRISDETPDELMIFEPSSQGSEDDEVMEVFSPPRVITVARRRGLKGEWAIDRIMEKITLSSMEFRTQGASSCS